MLRDKSYVVRQVFTSAPSVNVVHQKFTLCTKCLLCAPSVYITFAPSVYVVRQVFTLRLLQVFTLCTKCLHYVCSKCLRCAPSVYVVRQVFTSAPSVNVVHQKFTLCTKCLHYVCSKCLHCAPSANETIQEVWCSSVAVCLNEEWNLQFTASINKLCPRRTAAASKCFATESQMTSVFTQFARK